jgi:hypothetical protein
MYVGTTASIGEFTDDALSGAFANAREQRDEIRQPIRGAVEPLGRGVA